MNIIIDAPRPAPAARCPACGRPALDLGDGLFQCGSCGKVEMEHASLKHYLYTDGGSGFAVSDQPLPTANIRWACGVVPGCTHDTQSDANRHRSAVLNPR